MTTDPVLIVALRRAAAELSPGFELTAILNEAADRLEELTLGFSGADLRELAILEQVSNERRRQDRMWGGAEHDDTHDVTDWLNYIYGCSRKCIQAPGRLGQRVELVQIAALAVAAMQSMDRQAAEPTPAQEGL